MNVLLIAPRRERFLPIFRTIKAKVGRDKLTWFSGAAFDLKKGLADGKVYLNQVDVRAGTDREVKQVSFGDYDYAFVDQSLDPENPSMLDFAGAARGTELVEALTRAGVVVIGISRDGACNDVLADAGAVMTLAHGDAEKRLTSMLYEARRMVRDNTADPGELLALTLRQPWAASVFIGGKDVENRVWPARVRGTIAIHVAKDQPRGAFEHSARLVRQVLKKTGFDRVVIPAQDKMPAGAIIGLVDIVDCTDSSSSAWFEGPLGFKLANPRALPTPIPVSGKRRFWRVPKTVVTKIRRQLMEAGQPVNF